VKVGSPAQASATRRQKKQGAHRLKTAVARAPFRVNSPLEAGAVCPVPPDSDWWPASGRIQAAVASGKATQKTPT
jgi:hypothetical protein